MTLDLLIAHSKVIKERQKRDLEKIKSYKGDPKEARALLAETKKTLLAARADRKALIAILLKAADVPVKK
jgi:hypothetical protein